MNSFRDEFRPLLSFIVRYVHVRFHANLHFLAKKLHRLSHYAIFKANRFTFVPKSLQVLLKRTNGNTLLAVRSPECKSRSEAFS